MRILMPQWEISNLSAHPAYSKNMLWAHNHVISLLSTCCVGKLVISLQWSPIALLKSAVQFRHSGPVATTRICWHAITLRQTLSDVRCTSLGDRLKPVLLGLTVDIQDYAKYLSQSMPMWAVESMVPLQSNNYCYLTYKINFSSFYLVFKPNFPSQKFTEKCKNGRCYQEMDIFYVPWARITLHRLGMFT